MNLAGQVFDIYDDVGYSHLRDGAEKIAKCEITPQEKLAELDDSAFAVIIKTASGETIRKYPHHSEDARAISEFYLEKVANVIPSEIADAARVGLEKSEPVTVDMAKLAVSREATVWGLEIEGKQFFPLDTPDLVKEAAANFNVSAQDLLPEERYEYAQNIIKQAETLDVEVDRKHISGYSGTELNKLAYAWGVRQRVSNCLDTEKVAALKSFTPKDAKDAVGYLSEWDKIANMNLKRGVPDAYKSVYTELEKVASKNDKIKALSVDQLKTAGLDEDTAQQFIEAPIDVYNSLPSPVKAIIDERCL